MDSREFSEWIAYDMLELPSPYRMDAHFGNLVSTVRNMMRSPGQPRATIQNSTPDFDVAPRAVSKIKNIVRLWMKKFKAKKTEALENPRKKRSILHKLRYRDE